jgi:hypothetical protein
VITAAPLARLDRAAGGLAGDVLLYGISAGFAAITAVSSTLLPHRAWGAIAAFGYLAAALVAGTQLALRRPAGRTLLTLLTAVATIAVPLVVQAVQRAAGRPDRAQEEVLVVEDGGARLLHTGTPYLGHDAIAALPADERLLGYLPYQPGMALFGLPRAVAGVTWWTDARIWFALATAAALIVAALVLRGLPVRTVQFATVLPVCALTLATGGDDLPVLALCLLALAWCAADPARFGAAGLAVGAAAALKLFAWPVLAVLAVHAVRRRAAPRFLAGAVGLPLLALLPPLLVDPDAFVENVIRFPLGLGQVQSPAQSPFPGNLIANGLPGGKLIATALLVAAATAIAVRLVRRPPVTAAEATTICGYGLLAAILLMPSTRFGYLLYPAALLALVPAVTPRRFPPR